MQLHIQNCKHVATVLKNIETKWKEVFNWFSLNYLKANPDKCQLLLTSKDEASIKIDDTDIKGSSSKKQLLGVLIDTKFTFNKYVSRLCKKASNNYIFLLGLQNIWLKTRMNAFFLLILHITPQFRGSIIEPWTAE